MKMKKALFAAGLLVMCSLVVACSNILTYINHGETTGNIQCNGEKGLKRDSVCNVTTEKPVTP